MEKLTQQNKLRRVMRMASLVSEKNKSGLGDVILKKGNCYVTRYDRPEFKAAREILQKEGLSGSSLPDFHLNGYVVYPKQDIPREWHNNYDAEGLQLIQIHGGITYARLVGIKDQKMVRILSRVRKERERCTRLGMKYLKLHHKNPEGEPTNLFRSGEMISAPFHLRDKLELETSYTHVIFGFDTVHAGDENNPMLKDPEYVMELTIQMDWQLRAFAKKWERFKKLSTREEKAALLDEVRRGSFISTEMGLGGMLKILGGDL